MGFLSDILPTAGGIVGGIFGGPAGVGLGSSIGGILGGEGGVGDLFGGGATLAGPDGTDYLPPMVTASAAAARVKTLRATATSRITKQQTMLDNRADKIALLKAQRDAAIAKNKSGGSVSSAGGGSAAGMLGSPIVLVGLAVAGFWAMKKFF